MFKTENQQVICILCENNIVRKASLVSVDLL